MASSSEKGSSQHVDTLVGHDPVSPPKLTGTTLFMVIFSLWVGFAGWALQFDIGYTGIVLTMQPFNKAFGHCTDNPMHRRSGAPAAGACKLTATQQSLQSSIYILFMAVGAAFAGFIGNHLGRRRTVQVGCVFIIAGAGGMLGSSGNLLLYIACKCIGAVGIGHLQSTAPTYGVECCPPRKRGLLVTLYSAGSGFGSFIVALVCFGSSSINNDWSWKTPVLCQIPIAAVYACGISFFPESPRWLLTKGREEEARRSFSKLYSKPVDSPDITADIAQITEALDREITLSANTSWLEMFSPHFIRRTLTAGAIVVGSPICGTFFVFTYAAVFLTEVGISSPVTVVVVLNTCCFAGSIFGPFVVEYLGRRLTMLTGYTCAAVCMLIFAVVSSTTGETAQATKATTTAFICIWAFVFSGFIASSMWIASAEMHALRHRTYGQAFAAALSNIFTFAANFWTPYMINPEHGNMGTNVGYFYFGLEIVIFGVLFLMVPETGRLSLEQIDVYFTSGVKPWRTSLAKNKKRT